MKILKRATDAMKDKQSIYTARVARRLAFTHLDLEAAIMKATSHNSLDYKNSHSFYMGSNFPSLLSSLSLKGCKKLGCGSVYCSFMASFAQNLPISAGSDGSHLISPLSMTHASCLLSHGASAPLLVPTFLPQ
ncbi:hypothetical protein AMTR_s00002p00264620 [Amborella trichopoda]|uniref:Uncharacterized protein n=1 Tax=Amborella trichopoda TaxID=13333 RepID=W1NUV5_AMBTC|nr:hypothetical protein AMTR_s00002p00264620 [Amborella trichopoda]